MSTAARIAVVGGGISGLATAYYLKRESLQRSLEIEISVIDRSNRLGGVVKSERVKGFLLESGPENFVSFKPQALELITELGLRDQVIGSNDEKRRVFVLHLGRLQPLPEGMGFLVPVDFKSFWSSKLISCPGKIRALLEPLVPPSKGDLSVYSFLQRRIGKELTDKVAEPLVSAIYGGDVRRLSISSALPDTHRMEQRFGSLWRGMRQHSQRGTSSSGPLFLTMRKGMEQLIEGLVNQLSDRLVCRNIQDLRLHSESGAYRLRGVDLDRVFDVVILSTPAFASAEIIEGVSQEAAHVLSQINYASTTIVYLAYNREEFSHPLDGFGFVTPEKEARVLDACTWVSSKFEERCPPDTVLLRCAIHDGRHERNFTSDDDIRDKVHEELQRVMQISCSPVFSSVVHGRRTMPQFTLEHAGRMKKITRLLHLHPGLFLASAFTGGVGIPDCIGTGRRTAKLALDFLHPTP